MNKICLITGGGRGMGAATAREMHKRGYKLALMSPSERCEKLAAELGGVAHRGVAQSAEDIRAIFDLTMATYGRVDAVLNHTGRPPKGDLLEVEDDRSSTPASAPGTTFYPPSRKELEDQQPRRPRLFGAPRPRSVCNRSRSRKNLT